MRTLRSCGSCCATEVAASLLSPYDHCPVNSVTVLRMCNANSLRACSSRLVRCSAKLIPALGTSEITVTVCDIFSSATKTASANPA
jgi:hypothetical protein